MVLRKKIIEDVRPFIGTDVVKVITGMRRCGKSVLMSQIRDVIVSEVDKKASVFYLDLDDEANARYLKAGVLFKELTSILDKRPNSKTYVFLDEVHDVEGWEKTVNSIRKRKNADVYITGSKVAVKWRLSERRRRNGQKDKGEP